MTVVIKHPDLTSLRPSAQIKTWDAIKQKGLLLEPIFFQYIFFLCFILLSNLPELFLGNNKCCSRVFFLAEMIVQQTKSSWVINCSVLE